MISDLIKVVTPETNSKGWHRWALIELGTKEVLRVEYKSEDEVDSDNKMLGKDGKRTRLWVLNTTVTA